ncbi:unnamed protein product [Effrenium voratum]|nr:unnamed protein product [Effrenium voratum]
MAPPKLPAIHGRSGMEKSASMPRIEAPHPLTVPNFRRPDVSGQLQEIGQLSSKIVGPGGISKKMRALTASSSTPNLRGKPEPELRPEVSLEPSPPRSTGGTAYPAAAPAEVAEEKKLEYRKHPEKAHFNFRNLPLEIFDHTPDFEVKTPQEWMEEVLKDTSRPQACVVHYKRKEWTMVRCWVLRYEEAINRYVVELEDATHKKVKRLSLRFNAEDPKNFERRVETCRARKAHCELQEAFIDYIEYKDDKVVTPMPRSMKEFFIRSCLERCSLQEPNSHASTIRELMQEVEENYVLSMKLFNVEVELIPLFGTKEAFLPDESNEFSLKFEPVMRSFLPRPCPESGLVEHAKPEMAVKQLIAEMRQMPLLGANIFAITNQVWRRYMNEVAKLELIDTTRVGGVDVTRQRKLVKNSDSILFESQDMFEHQKNHIERITTHLKRGWRDYIIAEVLDKLSDDYNFFSDDIEKHMASPLHALLRKLDIIINSQLRWFLQDSMDSWCNFLKSFLPDPQKKRPAPLLYIDLEADQDEIYLEPEPQEFPHEFDGMLREAVRKTNIVRTMETELMPFTNVEEHVLFTPELSPDGDDVDYEPPRPSVGMSEHYLEAVRRRQALLQQLQAKQAGAAPRKVPELGHLREQLLSKAVVQGHLPSVGKPIASSADSAVDLAQLSAQRAERRRSHQAELAELAKRVEQVKSALGKPKPDQEQHLEPQVQRLRQLQQEQRQVERDLQQLRGPSGGPSGTSGYEKGKGFGKGKAGKGKGHDYYRDHYRDLDQPKPYTHPVRPPEGPKGPRSPHRYHPSPASHPGTGWHAHADGPRKPVSQMHKRPSHLPTGHPDAAPWRSPAEQQAMQGSTATQRARNAEEPPVEPQDVAEPSRASAWGAAATEEKPAEAPAETAEVPGKAPAPGEVSRTAGTGADTRVSEAREAEVPALDAGHGEHREHGEHDEGHEMEAEAGRREGCRRVLPLENACAVTVQVIDTCSEGPQQILEQFRKYSYLLREKVTDFDPTDIEACQQRIEAYRRAKYEVQVLSQSIVDFPLFRLRSAEIIKVLAEKAEDLAQECLRQVSECIEERADGILTEWDTTHRRILSSPESEKDMADLREFMEVVQRKVVKPLMERTRVVHQQMDMVEGFSHDVGSEVVEKAFRSFEWPLQINMDVMEADRQLNKDKIAFMEQLQREVEEYQVDFQKYTAELEWVKGLDSYAVAGQVAQRVQTLQDNLVRATDRVKSFSDREKLFQIDQRDYSDLEVLQEEYKPYFDLWSMAIEYNSCEEEWLSGKLANLSAGEVEQNVDDNFKDSYKAFKSFEGTPNPQKVAQELRSAVQAFKKNMPIIQGLCQPAIKTSHLLQLFEDMDVDIDMEDGLTLTMCLEAGMMDHVDKVEAISTSAQKQHGLKVALQTMKNEWKAMAFGTFAYKNTGTFLLKGADDVQALLDDHIIKTQAVRGSPFVKPIEKEVKDWEAKLLYIQDLLEQWLMVQRTWLYLEPIFCSEDIVRQMPEEAKKFQAVDKLWRDTMAAVEENPIVLDVSEIENLLLHFTEGNKKLDQIQKCLNDYLETKRLAFPRFFFLSNDELLMILSQTKDPTAVQPHMGKCFEGINRVRFDTNDEIIEAMISVEGEVVDLIKKVNVNEGDKKGNVERWLLEVQESMIHTLTKIMGDSVKAYAETKRDQWVLEWPGQVAIAVDNIYWTREVAEAIEKGKLADYYQVCATQLAELVELVRGELSKLARRTLTAMVTIDVHNRDVVANLRDVNVTSSKDFDWMAQLRYYWAPAGSIIMYETQKPSVVDHCQVSIINATLLYGFEYLGNSDRLVVTPLTDRCYRTLMGAFHLFYGGAPEGPAGTGKTESTKDLAKAMSVQCVVFNCSDGLDYLAMGKFFKGLASSGAWCCFDEFNRIDLEVLSVIAQQVACIQEAIRMKKRRFIFEDTELELIPTCAVNITMNPGYAGRSELPDNLKALFRPCAMMVPDYALIGEIVLYSVGFGNAKPLAAKAVASLRLGSEQLSSQDHYDFGMRALKSILVAAGQLRKKFGNTRAEDILMLSALNDVNLPKFTSNDIPLFLGITGDLFPGVKLPASDYGKLINELEGAAKARHLQPKGSFIHKCTQLWETIMVRHGLMVVGMNVSGKTEVEHVLSDALAAVADGDLYLPVQMHKINPKSIKQGQLYGDFDENTHEWTDGILALTVRYTANADPAYRQWIMLDGPVDAVWIENMNTVLDDNKKLCLNSGEIIKLSGVTTMMFEVEDLTFASPATVSRCGMVFMEQVDIGWRVLMQSWLETAPERLQECTDQLKTLLETNVDQCWEMCQRKIKTPVPVTQNWLVKSLLKLLLALLRIELPLDPEKDAKDIPAKEKEVKVENMFWLALVWSFGATTDSAGRKQMDRFIRSIQAGMPVKDEFDLIADDPTFRPVSKTPFPEKDSVFEYFAFAQSNKWESWTKKIMGFDIPKEALAHQIMVPTTDTVRSAFLLQTLVASEHHVLFSGLTGTGKTVVIQQELLKRFDKERYTVISFAFSAQTTANQTQDIIDGKLDKRKKGTYGPPFGKKCLLFIDDMNMPAKEKYDAQPPIELLRQWMDAGGWYDRKSAEFRNLVDLIFIGAMGPPGAGRPFLTGRYQRRFNLVFVTPFEQESLQRIFQSIMQWFLGKFSGAVAGAANAVVKSTIQLYEDMSAEMLPTPAKSHYTFNLRDLAKVHLGICRCHKKSMEAADDLARCWAHEAHRVFFDRLVTKDDQQWFQAKINDILKENFKKEWKALVKVEPLIWCDFIDPKANYYQQVEDPPQLLEVLNNCLVEYNTMAKRGMDLVLFMAAAQHVSQMVRVLKTPLGNALLVGVGGSGRKSLATLAAFVAEQETFQIEITKSYGMNVGRL